VTGGVLGGVGGDLGELLVKEGCRLLVETPTVPELSLYYY